MRTIANSPMAGLAGRRTAPLIFLRISSSMASSAAVQVAPAYFFFSSSSSLSWSPGSVFAVLAVLKLRKASKARKSLRTTAFLAKSSSTLMRSSLRTLPGIGWMSSTIVASTPPPDTSTALTPLRNWPPITASNVAPCWPPAG